MPDLAIAANAVSMLMPHAEPYVVATTRRAVDEGLVADPDLAATAVEFAAQEAGHQGQHRRYDDLLVARYPGLRRLERLQQWWFGFLRRRSTRFGLAFAAGFEAIAFAAAGWVDTHRMLLHDAEPTAEAMFLWHLAEEVEHKSVAFDLYAASAGGRWRLWNATWVAAWTLALLSLAGTIVMLAGEHRLWSPVAWIRLIWWSVSFVFVALPAMVMIQIPGHHPSQLPDPCSLRASSAGLAGTGFADDGSHR